MLKINAEKQIIFEGLCRIVTISEILTIYLSVLVTYILIKYRYNINR